MDEKQIQEGASAPGVEIAETLAANDPRHGTWNGYTNLGCRCDRCREAMQRYTRERRKPCAATGCGNFVYGGRTWTCREYSGLRTGLCKACLTEKQRAASEVPHGTESRYTGFHKCRCDLCRSAASTARRERRRRNRRESLASTTSSSAAPREGVSRG